jgi:hypothetical protein
MPGPSAALVLGFAGLTATAAAQPAPTCVPESLNNSALQAGVVTISPLPGSRDASPQTQISMLGAPAGELSVQSVVGSVTGAHAGRLRPYSQGDGASFVPSHSFAAGERVTVKARLQAAGSSHAIGDVFVIGRPDPISTTPEPVLSGSPADSQVYRSRSDLRPPKVSVIKGSPAVAPGDEFLAPYAGPGQSGPMILDPGGGLVWFKALARYTSATNFRVQEYAGKPVLTWWQGDISVHGYGLGEDVIADGSYAEIAHLRSGNGHKPDLHEFQLTPQGTALVTAYAPIYCNLSAVGGSAYDGVTDGVFQEIDVKTGLVMYEWTSLGHVALSESYAKAARSTAPFPYDFFHINSINLDRDGSFLISARNTWGVYDIEAASGKIRWRLGGKRSSFKAGPGTRTAWQHDPREMPDGAITLFDNGSSPTVHKQSRGIELSLDPTSGAATLIREVLHTPSLVAESQGNVQALANGDWFVGWGQDPFFSEYSPSGEMLFDARFPTHVESYRGFRFPWTGTPTHPPAFAFQPAGTNAGTVYASWNGATQVASWRVLVGGSPTSLKPIVTVARSGFETAVALPGGTVGPYVAVQALDAGGQVLGSSAAVLEVDLR